MICFDVSCSTHNSQDAALFSSASSATSSAAVNCSAFAVVSLVFMSASGPLVSSHISPQFLASVVQAVRVALAADEALVSGMEPRFHTLLFLQLVNLHSPRRLWGFLLRIWARRPQPSLLPGWVLRPSCHKPQYNHHKVGQLLLSPPCFKHS